MKVVILAGGRGTRLSEETGVRPKPMVEIGEQPILWHIMKIYAHHGFNDFVILLGYRGFDIKKYFADYHLHRSNLRFDLAANDLQLLDTTAEDWKVTLLDTGVDTLTGGRINRAREYLEGERFLLTYGDGVADVDIQASIAHHEACGGLITVTSVQPPSRFGVLDIEGDRVRSFAEKPKDGAGWINGGFFVCESEVLDYIEDRDDLVFEREPLEDLANDDKLFTYRHDGFWAAMDTLRDKTHLNELWEKGEAPWRIWK